MPTSFSGSFLIDTNIAIRLVTPVNPLYLVAASALQRLALNGAVGHICPQNVQELRQVATRPQSANGLGWSSTAVVAAIKLLEADFVFLPETDRIYPSWRRIVEATNAMGRTNFDARIVAVAEVHNIDAVLTFESAAFARYAAVASPIILDPSTV